MREKYAQFADRCWRRGGLLVRYWIGAVAIQVFFVLVVLGFSMLLTGCLAPPTLHTPAPQARTVEVARLPDGAYQCAMATFSKQSTVAQLTGDPVSRVFSGQWHHAVNIVCTVEAQAAGSRITVQGSVPPTKQTVGDFDEVDTLADLIKAACS
jgi:hypothetical protein